MFLSRNSSQIEIEIIKTSLDEEKLTKLEDLYQNFIDQTKNDKILYRFEHNLSSIYNAFKLVLNNENDLINKMIKFKNSFKDLNLKYCQAIKLSQIDQTTKNDLLEQLDKAWSKATLAKSKEKLALETLNSLQLEISNLSKLVEQVVGVTMGQEYNLREIIKEKETLTIDNKVLNSELDNLKQRIKELKQKECEQEQLVEEAKIRVNQADQELLVSTIQNQQNLRRVEKLEEENTNIKRLNDGKEANLANLNQLIQTLKQDLSKHEPIVKEYQQCIEKQKKENDLLSNRVYKIQQEIDQQYIKNESVQLENNQLILKLKSQEDSIESLRQETVQMQKIRDFYDRKIALLDQDKQELFKEKQSLELQLEILTKQKDQLLKELETIIKKSQLITNEKDQLNIELTKFKLKIENLETELIETKLQIKKYQLGKEINDKEITKLEHKTNQFEKERSQFSKTKNNFSLKLETLNHQIKIKDCESTDRDKKLKEYEIKLEKLSKMHETVRAERNSFSKLNNESKEQILSLKEQNESFKLDLNIKNNLIKQNKIDYDRLCYENSKVEKSLNQTREQLDQTILETVELKKKITSLQTNELKLVEIISDSNRKIELKNKAYEKIELERNIFGTQLVRRNDEITLLYEKIKLVQDLNKKGEIKFKNLFKELKLNQCKLQTLKKEKELKQNENFTLKKYKQELSTVQEGVILEKAKRNIAELGHSSYNIHRWRRLRGSDPTKYDLIIKVNFLQKKLISKSLEISNFNIKFQEKDRLFIELNKCLARRLLNQDFNMLTIEYQRAIETRNNQLKCLMAENSMLTKQNQNEQKKSNDALESLKEFKRKYFVLNAKCRKL